MCPKAPNSSTSHSVPPCMLLVVLSTVSYTQISKVDSDGGEGRGAARCFALRHFLSHYSKLILYHVTALFIFCCSCEVQLLSKYVE